LYGGTLRHAGKSDAGFSIELQSTHLAFTIPALRFTCIHDTRAQIHLHSRYPRSDSVNYLIYLLRRCFSGASSSRCSRSKFIESPSRTFHSLSGIAYSLPGPVHSPPGPVHSLSKLILSLSKRIRSVHHLPYLRPCRLRGLQLQQLPEPFAVQLPRRLEERPARPSFKAHSLSVKVYLLWKEATSFCIGSTSH